jgi:hypothetical protein
VNPEAPASHATVHPIDAKAATYALVEAATTAGYAPSIHDTQPWRWRLGGKTLELFIDRGRVLDLIDPDGSLATLSCGAALHHARVSLAAQGWQVTAVRMPDHTHPDCLARLVIGGHRIPVGQPDALHQRIIPLRRTDRQPVTGPPVDPESIDAITAAVEAEDTWLHVLHSGQMVDLANAARHVTDVEAGASTWTSELRYLTDDRPSGRDVGYHGARPTRAADDTTAVFAMLYGQGDKRHDWLRAGEALSAAWLTATEHGDSVLPLCAPAQVLSTRQALQRMVAGIAYPFLMLRLGVIDSADPGLPHAPRLPTGQTIERP